MRRLSRACIVLLALLLVWQGVVSIWQLPDYFLPGPMLVLRTIAQNGALLLAQTWPTVIESLIGLFIAILWGALTAIGMMLFSPLRFGLLPILVISQALPTFAVAPILVIWLGYGLSSKIAIAVLALFFPVAAAFYDGLRRTQSEWLDLAFVMGGSRWRQVLYIRLPAALPALASGIRVAAAWAPMAAVIGEWVGASQGLGFLMLDANMRMATPLMFAALTILVIFSLLLYFIVDYALKALIPWQGESDG